MPTFARVRAYAVHILTASGAAFALMAMVFATGGHWEAMFVCLGLALVVDGVDGPLAREFKVAELLPRWSGDTLDLVVDFTTYVFVPAYAIAASGLLPVWFELAAGIIVVICGALYFADRDMKTDDNYFRGFPALWNLVVFYVFVLTPPPAVIVGVTVLLAILTFLPIPFLHPVRVVLWRSLTLGVVAIWAVLAIVTLLRNFDPGWVVDYALVAIAIYFIAAGLITARSPSP